MHCSAVTATHSLAVCAALVIVVVSLFEQTSALPATPGLVTSKRLSHVIRTRLAQVAEVLRPSHSQHIKHAVRRQLLRPIQEKQSAGRDQTEHTQQRSVYIHIT